MKYCQTDDFINHRKLIRFKFTLKERIILLFTGYFELFIDDRDFK